MILRFIFLLHGVLIIVKAFQDEVKDPTASSQIIREETASKDLDTKKTKQNATVTSANYFDNLAESRFFLDKTMFFEYILTIGAQHSAFLAPRKFGKSSLLLAFKIFAEVRLHTNGSKVEDTTDLPHPFSKTEIFTKRKSFFYRHFGQYPIVYFNFSTLTFTNPETFRASFGNMIHAEYQRHQYLLKNADAIRDLDSSLFKGQSPGSSKKYSLAGQALATSLGRYFEKRPLLLVDDCDSFRKALTEEYFTSNTNDLKTLIATLSQFLNELITGGNSDYRVLRSIFVGTTRLGGAISLEKIDMTSIFDSPEVARFFGATEEEVKRLAADAERLDQVGAVHEWYGGYSVIGTTGSPTTSYKLYNTQSVVRYMETGRFEVHWGGEPHLKSMEHLFKYRTYGKEVFETLNKYVTKVVLLRLLQDEDVVRLCNLIGSRNISSSQLEDNKMLFFQYLTDVGYYAVSEKFCWQDISNSRVAIPNEEIRKDMEQVIFTPEFVSELRSLDGAGVEEFLTTLENLTATDEDMLKIADAFNRMFSNATIKSERKILDVVYELLEADSRRFRTIKSIFKEKAAEPIRPNVTDLFIQRKDRVVIIFTFKFSKNSVDSSWKRVDERKYLSEEEILAAPCRIYARVFVSKFKKCRITYCTKTGKRVRNTGERSVPKDYRRS